MSKPLFTRTVFANLFYSILLVIASNRLHAQLAPTDFVLLSGPNGTGTTLIGSSITVNGGVVGAYKLVQTTGNVTFNGAHIYCADKISLTNSNIVNGKIAAAANFPNSPISTGTILSVGSSTSISGNIDVYGNVVIGGGIVSGTVTIPVGKTYSGPTPGGGLVYGSPSLPVLPALPGATTLPAPLVNPPTITNNQTYGPGSYGNINYSGNKTLTLDGPGTYFFNSFLWSGNSNKLVFNFKNQSGNFTIYVYGDADFGKLNASITNGGNASRIYLETQGTGSTSSIANNSFVIANGSSGAGSKWVGSVFAPNGSINIGSGTGSSLLTGTFASRYSIAIQSGVTLTYSAPCTTVKFVNAGADRPLAFTNLDVLVATSTQPGTSFSWQATNGGVIASGANSAQVNISAAGTYIVTGTTGAGCISKDTVVISARVINLIGAELLSIYQNRTVPNLSSTPFFTIQNGYVLIDVIVNPGYYSDVFTALQTATYGLRPPYYPDDLSFHNGQSNLIITGQFPIENLITLDNFNIDAGVNKINFIRTYYIPVSNSGLVTSAGDTTIRTWLVRSGYNVTGNGIKIGVISDSYATKRSGSVNPITQTAAQDVLAGDLPGDTSFTWSTPSHVVNPFGFNKNVHVLQDFPLERSDEGRGMLQIIHDIAPGSELYFRTGFFTNTDFAKGIKDLRDAGCNIIVDDMTYMNEPFLKDGVVAKTVDTVVGEGVTYFSATGNFDKQSYEKDGNFVDASSIGFTGKKAHNYGNNDLFQQVKLRPGNYVFVLQWLDGIHSTGEAGTLYDVDFYISQSTNGTGLIGFNRDNTNGDPIEFIPIKIVGNSETDTTSKLYNVLIINNTATGNPTRLKYIVFKRDAAANIQFMNHIEGTSTCVGQANAAGAIAVGAARFDKAQPYLNPPQIEVFSSTGGTKTNGVVRLKPDITAPDGINVTVGLGPDYGVPAPDGYPNFFGTSAAAPHAAAAAALIMEGRKNFLGQNVVLPAQIKSMLQTSATDMETPGFDFISGAGLINIDMTMRTFAAPRPHIDSLVVPVVIPPIVPGDTVFTVTIRGNNFRPNSIAYFRDSALASTVILDTINGIATAVIPKFEGNPPIRMYTPPYPTTNGTDGGFSNNAYFFENRVVVKAVSYSLKYGDPLPTVFDTIITINDTLLQNSRYTLADLGFDNDSLHIQLSAPDFSNVGTYLIRVFRNFTPGNSADSALLRRFSYKFIDGTLSIAKLPVKVVPDDITFAYGEAVPNITYKYYDENGVLITNPVLLHLLDSSHHESLPDNVLGVVSGYATSGLTDADLENMSGMSTFQAIINSRKFQTVNGEWVPASDPAPFNVQYLVDVSAQSIKNFKTSSLTDDILVPAYPGVHSRAMVKASALMNGTAQSGVTGNLVHLVNGQLVPVVNSAAGDLVPIVNGQLVQLVNGVTLQNVNGQLVPVVNGQLVQLVNGEWMQTVNGQLVPVVNGQLVQLVNGQLVQLVNGQLVPLVNGQLVQLVNGLSTTPVQMSNGQLVQLVNGQLVPVVNGLLVQLVNGQLVQDVNGQLVPLVNGQLVQLVNGQLVQLVNGQLVQLVNGIRLDVGATNGLVQIVNGQLVQLVNGQLVPLVNGVLVQLVNGQLVPVVNSYGAGAGGNENAAVIIDSDDVELQDGFIGAMFSTNMITGLDVGQQTIVSATMGNSNFAATYGLGHATITSSECLQIHTPFKNFGNTTQNPTSLWLNVVTKVSGQLNTPNDSLIFRSASTTFNFINSTPIIDNFPLPAGAIVADPSVTEPVTHFDFVKNMWVTRVPVGFASTSDIIITAGIINSSTGFQKMNGNTNTVVKGKFYCTKNFSDQWAFAIAAYQPQFTYETVGDTGQVVSINGNYRAATPIPILNNLVQGGSGGGGNNYTGSKSSFQAFSACELQSVSQQRSAITSVSAEEQSTPLQPEMLIHPNPVSEMLNLSFVPLRGGTSRVEIFSINGSKVFEIDYGVCEAGNRYSKKINVSKLVNGVYLVRLTNAGNVANKKIVIAR
jgi:hypothetical protein